MRGYSRSARAAFALLSANVRYWTTVAPQVRRGLAHWRERASAIPDPALRELASGKLLEERFNIEVAATLGTLAPPAHRPDVVEAIVALQIAYDYLDLLGERQPGAPPDAGTRLLDVLVGAFGGESAYDAEHDEDPPRSQSDGYVRELARTTRLALAKLPASGAVAEVAFGAARRCAEAQRLTHASGPAGAAEREAWARREAAATNLQWPEYLAGAAASVLSLHALVAAAATPHTTVRDARAMDTAYLSICALTMLDSLVDRPRDLATGELSYVDLYGSAERMTARLALVARDAAAKARALPNGAHHLVTLAGIVAYYTSALTSTSHYPPSVTKPIRDELQPSIAPTLALMRAWRLAKRARARWRG